MVIITVILGFTTLFLAACLYKVRYLSSAEEQKNTLDAKEEEQFFLKRKEILERLASKEREVEKHSLELQETLGRTAGISISEAKERLARELEAQVRHDGAKMIRQVEEEVKRDADIRARNILASCMQRLAGTYSNELTVSVVELASDEMKGKIIGKEGRNIKVLEQLTGVDIIVDDTPHAVVLSSFDAIRREIAKLTLERLLEDGRVHPARIEETYYRVKSHFDQHIVRIGEDAVIEANVQGIASELIPVIGKLKFRTSYGQNVLRHSIECAHLAAMIAAELGADVKTARRAALLHDIGKVIEGELEGPHALVGGQFARKHGETEEVANAMEAHHNEVEPKSIEAVIVQMADALSGARPGARGEAVDNYLKRLSELEKIASSYPGVETVYAMQAGREVRVIVSPLDISDERASALSYQIARRVEKELEYPGQIKITVVRESRATDYAK